MLGFVLEIVVRGNDTGILIRVTGEFIAHRVAERSLVKSGRPNFVGQVGVVSTKCLWCIDQRIQAHCGPLVAITLEHLLDRIDEQLQSGEPLLSIDNDARFDPLYWVQSLLQNNCAHEVATSPAVLDDGLGHIANVFPQRLPLVILGPNVWALENWDLVAHDFEEDILRGQDRGLHFINPS